MACRRLAEKQAEGFSRSIVDREGWLAKRTASLMDKNVQVGLDNPAATVGELLALMQGGRLKVVRPPCDACHGRGVVELEDGTAADCHCKVGRTA